MEDSREYDGYEVHMLDQIGIRIIDESVRPAEIPYWLQQLIEYNASRIQEDNEGRL